MNFHIVESTFSRKIASIDGDERMGKKEKPMMKEDEQKKYLEGKKGNLVKFKYPEPQFNKHRELKDRFVFKGHSDEDVTYWFVMDQIDVDHGKEEWFRMTYYRYKKKPSPKWVFAGQNSFSGPIDLFREFFVNCIKEKDWIRPLFKDIKDMSYNELK